MPTATGSGPETLAASLRRMAHERGAAPFATVLAGQHVETVTFAELYGRSCAYAQRYARAGVRTDDIVIVMLQHSAHLFYAFLGAILAGAIPSFMPFPSARQRADLFWADHRELFARIHPRLLVTFAPNDAAAEEALGGNLEILIAGDDVVAGEGGDDGLPGLARLSSDIACLQHSSGTTAVKKGVMLSHRAIAAHGDAYARAIGLQPGDRIASWLPLYHDMGFVACFLTALRYGTHLVAIDPFAWVLRPHILLDAIERYACTLCWLPNFAFSHLANTAREGQRWDLSSMRLFVNCSEPCKPATFERFLARFRDSGVRPEQLHVCYAMAENVFAVTQTAAGTVPGRFEGGVDELSHGRATPALPGESPVSISSCGHPIAGVQIRVCGSAGNELPERRVGEVLVRSPFLFDGYYLLPQETARSRRGDWYATGDLGFIHESELFVTGRIDDMLIVNGRNYYAHEIEAIVNGVPGIAPGRTIAITVDDEQRDAVVIVVLAETTDGGRPTIAQEVNKAVGDRLGIAVHDVVLVGPMRLVKTTSGKLNRERNRQLYLEGSL